MNTDLELSLRPTIGLPTVGYSGTANGTAVELLSFEKVYMHMHVVIMAASTATIELQTSDSSGSGFTTVAGTAITLTSSFVGLPNLLRAVRSYKLQRYVRVALTAFTGTPLLGVSLYFVNPKRGEDQSVAYLAASN